MQRRSARVASHDAEDNCQKYMWNKEDYSVRVVDDYVGDEVYRGVQSLKQVLEKCGANIDMTHIKAGTLRKYLATNCQLLNLSSTELDWVVRHLGHSKLTHLSNYRLTSSTVEKTKIAKLLVLLENGMLSEAQGSSLNDQQLDELILEKLKPKGINEKDDEEEVPDLTEVEQELENSETGFVQDTTCHTTEGDPGIASHSDSEYIPDSDAHESSSEDCTDEPAPKRRKVDVHVQRRNKKWPPEAEDVLKREFSSFLHGKTYPSFREIRRVRKKHQLFFGDRTEAQIKSKLAHLKNCLSSV